MKVDEMMTIDQYSLPDPSDADEYHKLKELVSRWIDSRDLNVIRAGFVALARNAQSDYVSVILDRESTNTDFRRYGRNLAQCERLAAALAAGGSAGTMHLVADYPVVRSPLDILNTGLCYFTGVSAEQLHISGLGAIASFVKQVISSLGFSITLEISDHDRTTLLLGVSKIPTATDEKPSYLLLLSELAQTNRRIVSVVGHLLSTADKGHGSTHRVLALQGDLPLGKDLGIQFISLKAAEFRALKEWCHATFSTEIKSQSPYPRFERPQFENPPTQLLNNPTSEMMRNEIGFGSGEEISLPYITMPFRGSAVAGFFDLLGFSTFLESKWPSLESPEKILKRLRDDLVDTGVSAIGGACFPEIRTISDSIIAFTPATPGTSEIAGAIMTMAKLSHTLQYLAARLGFGLRGGIELGQIYCDSVDIIGPAVARTVGLERFANTMRTVIGPALLEDLASQMGRFSEGGTREQQIDGRTVTIRVTPLADTLFRYLQQSEDGLWRVRYHHDITEVIRRLHREAPTLKTKAKYLEFIKAFEGDKFELMGLSATEVPGKDNLLSSASWMRGAMSL